MRSMVEGFCGLKRPLHHPSGGPPPLRMRDLCITPAKRSETKPLPFRGGVGVGNVGENGR
jgi:hypothetical protein